MIERVCDFHWMHTLFIQVKSDMGRTILKWKEESCPHKDINNKGDSWDMFPYETGLTSTFKTRISCLLWATDQQIFKDPVSMSQF